jgi:hypothetical protein
MSILPRPLRANASDLPDVPSFVQYVVAVFLTPILAWLETLVYRPILARCADHPLVLLARYDDPSAVVAACHGFHHPADAPGRPPTFPIALFVRAEIVRAWAESCSDRDLEQLLSTNLLVRWFVGLLEPVCNCSGCPGAPDTSLRSNRHQSSASRTLDHRHRPRAYSRPASGTLQRRESHACTIDCE